MRLDFKRGDNGDLVIEDGQFRLVGGRFAIAQFLRSRLESWTQEWFLNLNYGSVSKSAIMTKAPVLSEISAIRKSAISTVPGLTRIISYRIALDPKTRNVIELVGALTEDDEDVSTVSGASPSGSTTVYILGTPGSIS